MTLSGPQDARSFRLRGPRANYLTDVGRLSARHDEIGDLDLHSLIILVKVGDQICGFGYYKVRREIRTVRHRRNCAE